MLGLTEFEGANEERIAYLRGAQRRLLDRGLTMNIKVGWLVVVVLGTVHPV